MSSWHRNNPEEYEMMINRGIAKKFFPRTFEDRGDELLCDLDDLSYTDGGQVVRDALRENSLDFLQSEEADRYGSQIDEIMDRQ